MKFATCMAIVFASAVSAQAAQPVAVNSLNAVGLSNVVALSDVEGTQIRAKYRNRGNNAQTSGNSSAVSSATQRGAATSGSSENSASSKSNFGSGALASQGNASGSLSAATGGSGRTSAAGTISGGSSSASGR